MYQPAHFQPADAGSAAVLMREHPLAHLVWLHDGAPTADPLPLMLDPAAGPQGVLRGHVARANPLWRGAAGQRVLAIFSGPQGYVTPSWYPSKAATAKVVPTWNYMVVHAHGMLRTIDDAAWLRALVEQLTDTHEARRAHAWQVGDAPTDYIDKMISAIVGIEIELTRVEAKFKLSQNRSEPDRLGVQAGLLAEPQAMAHDLAARVADPR
jgi:transcriptional regulator